jgi:hypothetical protein
LPYNKDSRISDQVLFDTEILVRQAQKEGRHYGRAQEPAIKGNLFSFLDIVPLFPSKQLKQFGGLCDELFGAA